MSIKSVNIHGTLGRDSEARYTKGGTPVVNFSIATDEGFGAEAQTEWWDCAMYGERAMKLSEYLVKGKSVVITGRLVQEHWEKDGQKHSKVKIVVNDLDFDKGNKQGDGSSQAPAQRKPKPSDGQFEAAPDIDIDIPVS